MRAVSSLGTTDGLCFRETPKPPEKKAGPSRYELHRETRKLLPNERLARCHRHVNEPGASTAVYIGKSGRSFFGGLIQCGNPWACPLCAFKISQTRRDEVQKGIDAALAYGAGVTLTTLTFRHGIEMPLSESLEKFAKALRRLKSGRAYKQFRNDFGIRGDVRALETTYGKNGWHPHTHAVTFTRKPLRGHELTRMRRRLFVLWYQACKKEKLPLPTYRHGVDVRPAKYAADYVAKWGFAAELTRSHLKRGHNAGRTPWQLLMDSMAGDKRAGWLFREFAMTFKGRRQLIWTRGLREYLGIGVELTDQVVMELEEQIKAEYRIDSDDWKIICKFEKRGQILDAAAVSEATMRDLIEELRERCYQRYGSDGRYNRQAFIDNVVDSEELFYERRCR